MLEKIAKIIGEITESDPAFIKSTSSLINHLGMDSMMIIFLIVEIEKIFNIKIPEEEIIKFITVQDIINFIMHDKNNNIS